ncbi:GUN4 domain-containing protein [Oscillatoriales cyanobacterium LEGE 11467]|uniref:GUN4 domain-containing protein n=1 Tax=Zarconia navalis LEGE 11467 TaxID=1828826 RepID=A0A928VXM6_9CYAN|nr:GUN4 domain-containing protein [Zarconia navalis]MBE9042169.1 GUN4 domain-containing protein [Zarconia navalis LEGE 11467]
MQNSYYTYRIKIENHQDVKVEKRDLNDRVLENPSGKLRLDKLTDEARELLQLSKNKQLNESRQSKLLGEALFDSLFDDVLCQNFIDFYDLIIRKEQKRIRIELDINEKLMPELAALPWEFMCLPQKANSGSVWLATAPNLAFSRRRTQCKVADPISLQPNEKLRIALVIAEPQGLNPVVYEKVKVELENLASEQAHRVELLPIVRAANPKAVDSILKQKPHIFHFIGHGRLSDENHQNVGQIAFVDEFGGVSWEDANDFSNLFTRNWRGILVLQACESGALSESQPFVGLASRVVQQNVPVVIAMQYEVSNSTASQFSCRFYKELAEGKPVDVAVQESRYAIALSPKRYRTRDFATPVIFMQVADGNLFQWQENTRTLLDIKQPSILQNKSQKKQVSCAHLETLLSLKSWREADKETKQIVLTSRNKINSPGLEIEDVEELDIKLLEMIDSLWMKYSDNKFGISLQHNIWKKIISTPIMYGFIRRLFSKDNEDSTQKDKENVYRFGEQVGWCQINKPDNQKWIPYKKLTFNLDACEGHLPYSRTWCSRKWGHGPKRFARLMSKFESLHQ